MIRTTRLIALGAALGLLALAAGAPAQAAKPPKDSLISAKDLATFGPVDSASFSISAHDAALPNPVCLGAAGEDLAFPNASGWDVNARILERGHYVDVTEAVLDYGTTDAAAKAYEALSQAAANCAPTTRTRSDATNRNTYDRVVQSTPAVPGAVAVAQRRVIVSKDTTIDGSTSASYHVYRLAGSSIVEVQYYSNPGKSVSAKTQAKVNRLSSTAACRLTSAC